MGAKKKALKNSGNIVDVQFRERAAAMNEELMLAVVRQHQLMEAADRLNVQLQAEIAERRQAEENLRESESKYRLLFENVLDGIFYGRMLFDETGLPSDFVILNINDAFVRLTGIDNAVGKKFTELFPGGKESNPELLEIYGRVAMTGRPEKFEVEFGPLGAWFAVSAYSNEKGYFVATFDNITKRKRAENVVRARLRLSVTAEGISQEELLQKALDEIEALTNSRAGFYHYLEADQETLSLQNWSTNTLENMCTAEGKGSHYPVSEAGVWVDCLRERRPVVYNDYASLPNRKGMPPGHAPITRLMLIPIVRGNRTMAIIGVGNKPDNYNEADIEAAVILGDFSWEIIERKRAEEALRVSEHNYRRLFESAKNGILLLEADGGAVFDVNPMLTEMLGYTREELLGRKLWGISPLKDIGAARGVFEALLNEDQTHYEYLPLQASDGRVIEVEVISSVYNLDRRKIVQCSIQDITERKLLEKEKADFYAMITHDIRSPLMIISGYSELLKTRADEFDAETNDIVSAIMKSVDNIKRLVENFLSISKAEAGKLVINPVPTDIAALLREACKEIEPAARDKNIDLQMEIPGGLPKVMVDSRLIRRAVQNLLVNAVNYTRPPGKVTLKAVSEGGDLISISVTDTGEGIPAAEQKAIFEKYYRSKRTSGIQGSGLGLAIVKAAADAHGGRIEVESRPGKGSTFRLVIPVNNKQS